MARISTPTPTGIQFPNNTSAFYLSISTVHSTTLSFPQSSSTSTSLSFSFPASRNLQSLRPSSHRKHNPKALTVSCSTRPEPLKVMISGAPASGKGTQCELIVQKYGLVHLSTGDLLRAEVSSGTEIGKKAKEYMESGRLVPDEIVTAMVTSRLARQDAKEKGWLLDGYPRSYSQAQSLEGLKIRPDIYVVLDVPDEVLIDRCVGRRLDPVAGKIYHIKNFPPETEEISARLITRSDDTVEKVTSRLSTYKQNAESISSTYVDVMNKVDGNRAKDVVFEEIDSLLQKVQEAKAVKVQSSFQGKATPGNIILPNMGSSGQDNWRGVPTRLNNIPHSREIRKYFYDDILQATQRAVEGGRIRMKVEINIPELNPEMDVYRIGTLMELARELALSFADDGKHVKDMKAMTDAAGSRPVILVNPRLKDLPGSSGIMQQQRLWHTVSHYGCSQLSAHALALNAFHEENVAKMSYPYRYELYRRVDEPSGREKYVILATFPEKPTIDEINDAFSGKPSCKQNTKHQLQLGAGEAYSNGALISLQEQKLSEGALTANGKEH
ncbi:hypothetical protein ACLOJK_027465 [Asimina triloba]